MTAIASRLYLYVLVPINIAAIYTIKNLKVLTSTRNCSINELFESKNLKIKEKILKDLNL